MASKYARPVPAPPPPIGWVFVANAHRWHFFLGDRLSACRQWDLPEKHDEPRQGRHRLEGTVCRTCAHRSDPKPNGARKAA